MQWRGLALRAVWDVVRDVVWDVGWCGVGCGVVWGGVGWGGVVWCRVGWSTFPSSRWAQAFVPPGLIQAVMRPALGQLRSFCTLLYCAGQWAVGTLQYTATL